MFDRFRSRHNRTSSLSEEILSCCTVDLHTSTIKMDAEDMDLRLCFRIISPLKTYTLQVIDRLAFQYLNNFIKKKKKTSSGLCINAYKQKANFLFFGVCVP